MKTMALYLVPNEGEQAKRFSEEIYFSPARARGVRRMACADGTEVAIHVGHDHPEVLPFGEKLWREPKQ